MQHNDIQDKSSTTPTKWAMGSSPTIQIFNLVKGYNIKTKISCLSGPEFEFEFEFLV
jgi:hypothetical protein